MCLETVLNSKDLLRKYEQLGAAYTLPYLIPLHESLRSEVGDILFYLNYLLVEERKLSNLLDRKIEKQGS